MSVNRVMVRRAFPIGGALVAGVAIFALGLPQAEDGLSQQQSNSNRSAMRSEKANRPTSDLLLRQGDASASADRSLRVAAEAPGRRVDLVYYRSVGKGYCAGVVGAGETQLLCREAMQDAVEGNRIEVASVGPTMKLGNDPSGAGEAIAGPLTWGVTVGGAASVRFTRLDSGETTETSAWTRADVDDLSFFVLEYALDGATLIEAMSSTGEVIASRTW
jgi:hypothetical protein